MPKRVGNLYDQIWDARNVKEAFINAVRRKKSNPSDFTSEMLGNPDLVINAVILILRDEIFEPSEPNRFRTVDKPSGKVRDVQAPKLMPDQIVHWALMQVIQPIIMRGMYQYCCGSIPTRGPALVKHLLERKLRSRRGEVKYRYCLKLDIHHYFQSIDHDILKAKLAHKIKDPQVLNLCYIIIDSVEEGLPIGYYTSQWFANFFLEDLDHYILEKLGAKCYVRYIDDIVICGPNKRKLHKICVAIAEFLERLHLKLKDNYQVFRVDRRGIDFCGFRFYHDRTTLRKRILVNLRKANRMCDGPATKSQLASAISYCGWLEHTDTRVYSAEYLKHSKDELISRWKRLDKHGFETESEFYKWRRLNKPHATYTDDWNPVCDTSIDPAPEIGMDEFIDVSFLHIDEADAELIYNISQLINPDGDPDGYYVDRNPDGTPVICRHGEGTFRLAETIAAYHCGVLGEPYPEPDPMPPF